MDKSSANDLKIFFVARSELGRGDKRLRNKRECLLERRSWLLASPFPFLLEMECDKPRRFGTVKVRLLQRFWHSTRVYVGHMQNLVPITCAFYTPAFCRTLRDKSLKTYSACLGGLLVSALWPTNNWAQLFLVESPV